VVERDLFGKPVPTPGARATTASPQAERPRQLALALPHEESFSHDNFLEGPSNAAALTLIDSWPDWSSRVIVLTGAEGAGKSHLAAIWASRSGARIVAGEALAVDGVQQALASGALVVEDVATKPVDERALFHLLNHAREVDAHVLLTALSPPALWSIALPDLRSRLRALPVVMLMPPDDDLLRALIVKFCADRQLVVDENLVSYLSTRIERSSRAAREAVAKLDAEALRLGRPVTRALAAEIFRGE
jgi:chromosomal replication initiation ATPase DnaA